MLVSKGSYYIKDDVLYDRHSTIADFIIEPWMIDWKLKVGKAEAGKRSKLALKIGSRVDDLVERDSKGEKFTIKKSEPIEVSSCMTAWSNFKNRYDIEFIDSQKTVFDERLRVAGTLDLILKVNGVETLIDIKTSISISLKYWMQVSFYLENCREFNPADFKYYPRQTAILRLDKDCADYEYIEDHQVGVSTTFYYKKFARQVELYRFYNREKDITIGENHERIRSEISA